MIHLTEFGSFLRFIIQFKHFTGIEITEGIQAQLMLNKPTYPDPLVQLLLNRPQYTEYDELIYIIQKSHFIVTTIKAPYILTTKNQMIRILNGFYPCIHEEQEVVTSINNLETYRQYYNI